MMKKVATKVGTMLLIAVSIIMLVTRCGFGETAFASNKLPPSEKELTNEIKNSPSLGFYNSDWYDVMYILGIDGEVVILQKDGRYVLADNPEKGNNFYLEVEVNNSGVKPIGASSKYLFFEDKLGSKYAIRRITEKEEVNVGRGELLGMDRAIPFSELEEEEKNYLFIAYAIENIPTTSN